MRRDIMGIQVSMIPDYFSTYIKIPDIQREDTAWSLEQKQMLIDSLYNDYDIPKIYLRIDEKDPNIWWLIDGQQRLTAINEFINNKFALGDESSLPKEIHNKLYKDLLPTQKNNIATRTIDAIKLTCTEDEEEDMFLRLNKGTPLSAAEKRNAIRGEMRDANKELAKHKFFKIKINFNPKRFAVDAVCAQLTLLTIERGSTDTKGRQLRTMYEKNRKYSDKTKNNRTIKGILNLMNNIFPQKETYMKKYSISSFYFFLKELIENFVIKKISKTEFYKFFTEFETERQNNNRISEDSTYCDTDLSKYQTACINSPDSESAIRDRHEVLLKKFFLKYQGIEPKDSQRGFTQSQKEAIYYLNDRMCAGVKGFKCPSKGEKLGFFELEYDHIKEHSAGGKSKVSNGQPLCTNCHQYKSIQYLKKNSK